MARTEVVSRATFDPKLKLYWMFQVTIVFLATVAGIILIPFWWLGWGQWWSKRAFEAMQCELTQKSLVIKKGVWFKVEKTIPLDKIQDLTLREGPLLNALGLCSISVETAGQSGAQSGGAEANLVGVVNARDFRDSVLSQQEQLVDYPSDTTEHPQPETSDAVFLKDIRDSLLRIEEYLKHNASN